MNSSAKLRQLVLALLCLGLAGVAYAQMPPSTRPSPSGEEVAEIARDAYVYAYPMVLMHVTMQVGTNVEVPAGTQAPINQLGHMREFPDASFTLVVRPNADTLYSTLAYDVATEPLVVSVPDSGGRYYLNQWLDHWTDVFTSPGSRTTGTGAQTYAIVGPTWQGELPDGVREYRSPTARGLLIGRTQTNGKADYEAVRRFQDGMTAAPLSAYGKPYTPPRGTAKAEPSSADPAQTRAVIGSRATGWRFAPLAQRAARIGGSGQPITAIAQSRTRARHQIRSTR